MVVFADAVAVVVVSLVVELVVSLEVEVVDDDDDLDFLDAVVVVVVEEEVGVALDGEESAGPRLLLLFEDTFEGSNFSSFFSYTSCSAAVKANHRDFNSLFS